MLGNLFRRKLRTPVRPLAEQVAFALKSITLPETQPQWKLFSRKQEQRWWSTDTAIKEGFEASSIVYAAIEKRAKLVADVPWRVYLRDSKGELQEAPASHPLSVLLDNPNPDRSWYEIMYELEQSMCLDGNAYITEIRGGTSDLPQQLWLLPSKDMWIKPASRFQLVDYFEFKNHNITGKKIAPADMIHLRMPNPNDPIFGMPILMAAARATDIDRESGIWQKNSLENRTAADMHVEVPDGTTSEQMQQVRDKLKERNQSPTNARAPIVTSGKVNLLGHTAVEMDFVQSRKQVWTEIAAVLGTPLSTLGLTEDVNLANAESMNKQLWQNTIIPQLELYKRQFQHQLAADFGDNVIIDYDLSNVEALQVNEQERLDRAVKLWGMGVPFNVLNQKLELGFDDVEGGDIGYMPSGLLPVGFMSDEPQQQIDDVKVWELAYGKKDDS